MMNRGAESEESESDYYQEMQDARKGEEKIELYRALFDSKKDTVLRLCDQHDYGPFRRMTFQNATVIGVATYYEQEDLVHDLLQGWVVRCTRGGHTERLCRSVRTQDDYGYTVLHHAAAFDSMAGRVGPLLVELCPETLTIRNRAGETPLFRTAFWGSLGMFEFLAGKIEKSDTMAAGDPGLDHFTVRSSDSATILHIAIRHENFEYCLQAAKRYPKLCKKKDGSGMTALQLLSFNPTAFRSCTKRGLLAYLIYTCISTGNEGTSTGMLSKLASFICCSEKIRRDKRKHEKAEELAKYLITVDKSWKQRKEEEGESEQERDDKKAFGGAIRRTHETPLFLAAEKGCMEIVREVLERHPMMLDHFNRQDRNILHVAIKHRRREIVDLLRETRRDQFRVLIKGIDKDGNTALHMAASKRQSYYDEETIIPSISLQQELKWFETIKRYVPENLHKYYNNNNETAEALLAKNLEAAKEEAKEYSKRSAEQSLVVVILIATVAFAAPYTIPGGSNQETGAPVLLKDRLFQVFSVADALSLASALAAIVFNFSIITSSFTLRDFRTWVPRKQVAALFLFFLSVCFMMLAFAATIILNFRREKNRWTKVMISLVAFVPVVLFALTYASILLNMLSRVFAARFSLRPYHPRPTTKKPPPATPYADAPLNRVTRV